MKCCRYTLSILLVIASILFSTVFSMERTIVSDDKNNKTIGVQLFDNEKPYQIALWKVTHESNTLCEKYYKQKQNNPIIVHNISTQEIKLFDKALDTLIDNTQKENTFKLYCNSLSRDEQRIFIIAAGERGVDGKKRKLHAQRITAQLADALFDSFVIKKKILGSECDDFVKLVTAIKYSIISDNIRNNKNLIQEGPLAYGSDLLKDNPFVKTLPGGGFKFLPSQFVPKEVGNFMVPYFDGQPDLTYFEHEGLQYMRYAGIKGYTMTSSKIENGTISLLTINIWNSKLKCVIKSIEHTQDIEEAIFSPDGKWVISYSVGQGPASKLMLTCLDNTGLGHDVYLSDTVLVQGDNLTSAVCFNDASMIVANGRPGCVDLFDLVTKKCIKRLDTVFSRPLIVKFNHDGSRLIAFLNNQFFLGDDSCSVIIWDTHDMDNIEQIKKVIIPTKQSSGGNMFFSPTAPNILAVSNENATFFFDVSTGAPLSRTLRSLEDTEHRILPIYAGTTFMPYSSIALVGMNKSDGTSCVVAHDYMSGDCIGIIPYKNICMNGIGLAHQSKYVVNTFTKYNAIKTHLISDNQTQVIIKNVRMMNLVDFYALLRLHRARQQKCFANLSQPLVDYITQRFFSDDTDKEQQVIKKNFFS